MGWHCYNWANGYFQGITFRNFGGLKGDQFVTLFGLLIGTFTLGLAIT